MRHPFLILMLCLAAIRCASQSYQPVPGNPTGYTQGSFTVTDGGAATYCIKPVLTPGTGGLQPDISVAYNSQAGNGLIGMNMSLEGLSSISRAAQTRAQDGQIRGISFSAADRFALDGERLVMTDTTLTYGGNGVEYRTEQSTACRIVSFGTGAAPDYFRTETKAGLIVEYGHTADSKVQAGGVTLHWLVNRIQDRYGNYITFSYYQNPTTGEHYPLQINYTGNAATGLAPYASIQFTYESRVDSVQRFLNGKIISSSTKRLKSLDAFYGATRYRTYTFTYQYSPANVSELTAIQECGLNNNCNAPTAFTWTNMGTLAFSATSVANVQAGSVQNKVFSADLSARGVQDLVKVIQGGNLELYASNRSATALAFSNLVVNPPIAIASKFLMADFNADGKAEILRYDSTSGVNTICINTTPSTGTQFTTNLTASPIPPAALAGNKQLFALDGNGDGRTDLLVFDAATGTNQWFFSNSTGTAAVTFEPVGNLNYATNLLPPAVFGSSYQQFFQDLNGDGIVDALIFQPSTGSTLVYQNDGGKIPAFTQVASNVAPPALLAAPGGRLLLLDCNADNLPEILYYVKSTGATNWWLNKGGSSFEARVATPASLNTLLGGGDYLFPVDFNNDAYVDLVWIDRVSGVNRWLAGDGKFGFSLVPGTVVPAAELAGYGVEGLGNFTSKTSLDLFLYAESKLPRAKILKGTPGVTNVVSRITCGNGQATDIAFDLLTSDSTYAKGDSSEYPIMDYCATQPVVKNFQVDNGISGKSRVSFYYKGARVHTAGRGFRGCTEVEEKDEATGIIETRLYQTDSNSWKYISSPLLRLTRRLANGTVITQTEYRNGLKSFFGGRCGFSFVVNSTTKNYDPDGTFIDSVVTTNEYDDYGNIFRTVTDYGGGAKDSLVNDGLYNYPANWILGRLTSSHLYRMAPGKPTITKATAFEYDPLTGALRKEVIESDSGATVRVTKVYVRDVYGNILQDTVIAWNGSALEKRVTATTYDSLGRFPVSTTNAKGHTATKTFDPVLGHVTSETTPNNHTTQQLRDNLGRLTKVVNADGTWSSQDYRKCGGVQSCPPYATYLIHQQSSNTPPVTTYYNLLNQEVQVKTVGFTGAAVFVDKEYDFRGLLARQTEPYFAGATPNVIQHTYDALGRPVRTVYPGNRVDSTRYNGRTVTSINARGQTTAVTKDRKGNVVKVVDNQGNVLLLDYNAANQRTALTDPNGNIIRWDYDLSGNVTREVDPDRGTTTYRYNGFGELITTTRGTNTTTSKYDSLGRLRERVAPEGTIKWYYDGQLRSLGQLDSVVYDNGTKETLLRDTNSRVVSHIKRINGRTFVRNVAYDTLGRVRQVLFHTGFSLNVVYNAYGYQSQIRNTVTGGVYYTLTAANAKGQCSQLLYGNGTQIDRTYDATTGFLTGIKTRKGAAILQDAAFVYDALGNLLQRKDLVAGKQEDFTLDDLNRLTKTKVLNGDSVLLQYNSIGNILYKSDIGTYLYSAGAGPHQVVGITGPNAVCVPSLLVSTLYNSFDKVRELRKDSTRVLIGYDAAHQRNLQQQFDSSHLVRTKVYAFTDLEQEVRNGDTSSTYFISGPDGVAVTVTTHTQAGVAARTIYYHRDHLGSVALTTGDTGVLSRYSFDAWGRRRNSDWSTLLTDTAVLVAGRGFTEHESYDLFELIDMNGRVYDPFLGRFTSPDPIIQDVYNTQCINRYSYCANNPLSCIDPSGHSFFKKLFKGIGHAVGAAVHWVGDNWKSLATVAVAVAAGTLTFGIGGYLGATLSGAASGFASNVTSTLLAGGNLGDAMKAGLRGAVIGGITARLTFGIGEKFATADGIKHLTDYSNVLQKTLAHGTLQGVAGLAGGGDFIHGFLAGAVSVGSELGTNQITSYYGRVTAAAVVGGTTSELSGGNFANGAVSAAFVQMYNASACSTRPDADGYITRQEANDWYLNRCGGVLNADLDKLDLSFMSASDFPGMGKANRQAFNLLYHSRDGAIYGSLTFVLYKNNLVHGYQDTYDFETHHPVYKEPVRNTLNFIYRNVNDMDGHGLPFKINLNGSAQIKP